MDKQKTPTLLSKVGACMIYIAAYIQNLFPPVMA